LESLQSTQQKIKADSAGLATEQLLEYIKQAATQSATEVAVAQMDLEGLCSKISAPAE